MEQSYFIQWIKKYFPALVVNITEKLNDTTKQPTYLYKSLLTPTLSVTGKWESIFGNNSLVAADVVAMDSSLPLKKRGFISKASGDIPKLGIEKSMNETDLTNLDILIAQGGTQQQIAAKLFEHLPLCIGGIYERNEYMFLKALSTGVTEVLDTENVGTEIRLDFGIPAANQFNATTDYTSTANAKPFDDIKTVLDAAALKGYAVTAVYLSKVTFEQIAATDQAKTLFAFQSGISAKTPANIPTPSLDQVNTFTSARYGFKFVVVDRTVRVEKNGVITAVKPFATGVLSFVTSDKVGTLAYARLAEQNHPVAGVEYQTADGYIMASMFRTNRPSLAEITRAEARVVPVLGNPDGIFLLETSMEESS